MILVSKKNGDKKKEAVVRWLFFLLKAIAEIIADALIGAFARRVCMTPVGRIEFTRIMQWVAEAGGLPN